MLKQSSRSRDDKRYTEKKNKADRAKRKKDDNARLRTLVDRVLALDPRIARIKQEEKAAREAKKKGKAVNGTSAQQEREAEEKRKAEAAAKQKEDEEKARPVSHGHASDPHPTVL